MSKVPRLEAIVKRFPVEHVSAIFAYGSSVFPQHAIKDDKKDTSMTDLMFVTTDSVSWHNRNINMNPHDYSRLGVLLGGNRIISIQDWPGGMWFNAGCVIDGIMCKYGVMSMERAREDLTKWRDFTFAGRLHKPVLSIREASDSTTISSLNDTVNRPRALLYSLLSMTNNRRRCQEYRWVDVLSKIVGLSYQYDLRMLMAEDVHKVRRIVTHQYDALVDIYTKCCALVGIPCDRQYVYIGDINLYCNLTPRLAMADKMRIVKSNAVQSLKGLISADPSTAWTYLLRKLRKRFT